jgi:regulator of sirC expression with transglutaminase-like and TPR domain
VRDLGLIYFEQGRLHEAAHHLETYLRLAPDTPEAAAIRQNFQPEFARWARLN